jgi:hypothetical protein
MHWLENFQEGLAHCQPLADETFLPDGPASGFNYSRWLLGFFFTTSSHV